MKLSSKILALCLLQSASGFVVVQPKAPTTRQTGELNSFSYLGDLSGESTDKGPGVNGVGTKGAVGDYAGPQVNGGLKAPPKMGAKGPTSALKSSDAADTQSSKNVWDTVTPTIVQGGSLRTWSFSTSAVERVQVLLKTEGRPLTANVDLWQGPDNTPQKMGIYIEDGSLRPFSAVIETPRGHNAIAIRNTGQMEFPLAACVEADIVDGINDGSAGLAGVTKALNDNGTPETIQGGAIKTYSFNPSVASVQILLKTDGRPLNARIELLQGPNNNKQVIELYTEDGMERPFFAVIETPGTGNVVRVLNTAPVEFPLTARVEPYLVEPGNPDAVIVSDAGSDWDSKTLFFDY